MSVRRARPPLYPFLLALLPVLQLFSESTGVVRPGALMRPILALEGATVLLWLAWWRLTRDAARGAALTALTLLVVLLFPTLVGVAGRVLVGPIRPIWIPAHVHHTALGLSAVLWAALAWPLLRTRRALGALGGSLDLLTALWVGFVLATAFARRADPVPPTLPPLEPARAPAGAAALPHVFYIVADAYGRADVLHDRLGIDNEPFLARLAARGFWVAAASRANYPQTGLSLASSLNAAYLDPLAAVRPPLGQNRRVLTSLIDRNRVIEWLRPLGYRFVAFEAGAAVVELETPERVPGAPLLLNEFEHALLARTSLPALASMLRRLPGGAMVPDQYAAQRARVRHTLERLPDLAASDTPLLVLAHVLCPHPPFVFAADGSRPALPIPPENFFTDGVFTRSREEYAAGYGAQLAFLNARLEAAIDRILREARRPTIIVLQGDHGPGAGWAPNDVGATDLRERFAILNAYRFPDGDQPRLPPDITPVNTFRVILNRVGGADLPLLEDRSFYATWKEPYAFVDVTARVTGR